MRRREFLELVGKAGGAGAVYLCGEHMSYVGSCMAGAFESAHEVITALHSRASSA